MPVASNKPTVDALITQKYELSNLIRMLTSYRTYLLMQSGELSDAKAHFTPASEEDNKLNAEIAKLNQAERILESRITNTRTDLDSVVQWLRDLDQETKQYAKTEFSSNMGGGGQ